MTQQVEIELSELLAHFDDRRSNLIPILQEIQGTHFYLPEEMLRRVARKLQVPLPEVYQVATFYRCFSLKPRGKHHVQVCQGTACHVRGSARLLERIQTETATSDSSTTSPDKQFTVESVRCLGCCGLAPVMRVDKDTFAHLELGKIKPILNRYRPRTPKAGDQQEVAASAAHD
jgi:NADH:ubiquinone oxidoreductase subunit E